jgi:amidase
MNQHTLDALIAPTNNPAWASDLVNADHFIVETSSYAALAGYPDITVPAGFSFGLPIGVSFFGRAYGEPTLIRIASGFEASTRHCRSPTFLPGMP